jgi:hypothetical protein
MDGAILCKSIVKMVPKQQRSKMIALLCVNPTVDTSSTSKLMSHVIHAPSIAETKWASSHYPQNVCRLTESSTGMLEFRPNISELLELGSSIYRFFLSESSN